MLIENVGVYQLIVLRYTAKVTVSGCLRYSHNFDLHFNSICIIEKKLRVLDVKLYGFLGQPSNNYDKNETNRKNLREMMWRLGWKGPSRHITFSLIFYFCSVYRINLSMTETELYPGIIPNSSHLKIGRTFYRIIWKWTCITIINFYFGHSTFKQISRDLFTY